MLDNTFPATLSTFKFKPELRSAILTINDKLEFTSVRLALVFNNVIRSLLFALSAKLVFTSVIFAFKPRLAIVAYELKFWSPVFVPLIAANLFFSIVV